MNIHEIWNKIIKIKNDNNHKYNFLATYIYENKEKIIHGNIEEISKLSYTSVSTYYRFLKSLGLENFKELKFVIKNNIEMELGEKIFSLSSFDESVVPMIYEEELMNLNENFAHLMKQREKISKVSQIMKDSNKILIIGLNHSIEIANDIYYKLIKTSKHCIKSSDADQINFLSKTLDKNDLILIFSYSGNHKELANNLSELCKTKKDRPSIVSITTNTDNIISHVSDINIEVSSNESSDRIFPLKSRNSLLFASDCIFANYLNISPSQYLTLLNIIKNKSQYWLFILVIFYYLIQMQLFF